MIYSTTCWSCNRHCTTMFQQLSFQTLDLNLKIKSYFHSCSPLWRCCCRGCGDGSNISCFWRRLLRQSLTTKLALSAIKRGNLIRRAQFASQEMCEMCTRALDANTCCFVCGHFVFIASLCWTTRTLFDDKICRGEKAGSRLKTSFCFSELELCSDF